MIVHHRGECMSNSTALMTHGGSHISSEPQIRPGAGRARGMCWLCSDRHTLSWMTPSP